MWECQINTELSGKRKRKSSDRRQTVWDLARPSRSDPGQAKPNHARLSLIELGNTKPNRAESGRAQFRSDLGWAKPETSLA